MLHTKLTDCTQHHPPAMTRVRARVSPRASILGRVTGRHPTGTRETRRGGLARAARDSHRAHVPPSDCAKLVPLVPPRKVGSAGAVNPF